MCVGQFMCVGKFMCVEEWKCSADRGLGCEFMCVGEYSSADRGRGCLEICQDLREPVHFSPGRLLTSSAFAKSSRVSGP